MKVCPNCGQNADHAELFCGNCGAALEDTTPASPSAAFCLECGAALDSDAVFCSSCGTPVAPVASAPETPAPEASAPETPAPEASAPEAPAPEAPAPEAPAPETPAPETPAPETPSAENTQAPNADSVFCPNCGQQMSTDTVFCASCGTNIQAHVVVPPAPKLKKPLSHKTIGIAAVAAAVVLCAVGIFSGVFSSPASQFRSLQKSFFLDNGLNQAAKVVDSLTQNPSLSTDFTVTATTDDREVSRYLEDASLGVQIDYKDGALLAGGNLNMMGSDVLSGTIAYEKGIFRFAVPELDNVCYSMDVAKMYDAFGNTGAAFSELKPPTVDTAAAKKLYTAYFDILLSTVNKSNITVRRTDFYLPQLRKSVSGKLYTFKPSAEDINKMLLKLASTLQKDKALRDFCRTFLHENEYLFALQPYSPSIVDYEDALDDAITYMVDSILDDSDYIARQLEREGFRVILGVSGGKVCLQRIERGNGEAALGFERYGNNKEGNNICFYSEYNGSANGLVALRWTKDGSSYNGKLSLSEGYGSDLISVGFDQLNPGKTSALHLPYGSYRIQTGGMGSVRLEVAKGKGGGTDHVLRLADLRALGYYGSGLQGLSVTVNTTDKKSTVSRSKAPVVDLTYFSAIELYELMERLSSTLERSAISQFV